MQNITKLHIITSNAHSQNTLQKQDYMVNYNDKKKKDGLPYHMLFV